MEAGEEFNVEGRHLGELVLQQFSPLGGSVPGDSHCLAATLQWLLSTWDDVFEFLGQFRRASLRNVHSPPQHSEPRHAQVRELLNLQWAFVVGGLCCAPDPLA